jgi:hypothetical protein
LLYGWVIEWAYNFDVLTVLKRQYEVAVPKRGWTPPSKKVEPRR